MSHSKQSSSGKTTSNRDNAGVHGHVESITTTSSPVNTEGTVAFAPGTIQDKKPQEVDSTKQSKSIRVSITFKVGFGWRGTKSRDFPGRHFVKHERDLIQKWAKDFRKGESCFLPEAQDDTQVLILPDGAKRRKPFLGASVIRRQDAFYWFRMTQERLMNVMASKLPSSESKNEGLQDVKGSAESTDKQKLQTGNSVISLASQRHLRVRAFLPDSYVSRSTSQTEFIEVHWEKTSEQDIKDQKVFRLYLGVDVLTRENDGKNETSSTQASESNSSSSNNSSSNPKTIMRIPVNVVECGGGAFFCAKNIPPGRYTINGKIFTVHPPPAKVRKRRRRSSKEKREATSESLGSPTTSQSSGKIPAKMEAGSLKTSSSSSSAGGNTSIPHAPSVQNDDMTESYLEPVSSSLSVSPSIRQLNMKKRRLSCNDKYGYGDIEISPLSSFGNGNENAASLSPLSPISLSESYLNLEESIDLEQENLLLPADEKSYPQESTFEFYNPDEQILSATDKRLHSAEYEFPEEQLASPTECESIVRLKEILGDSLTTGRHAKYPEVVGDISLLRFLRGNKGNVEAAAALFHDHLEARRKFKMDDCRDRCVNQMYQPGGIKFSQDQLVNGALVRSYLPMEYNCGMTPHGDPVCAIWYTGGRLNRLLRDHGTEKVLEYTVEQYVRRQIQLDMLARHQGRLTRLVCFMQCLGGLWRLLAPGRARDFFSQNIGTTMPELISKIYMVDASWAMKRLWQHFKNYMKSYKSKMELMGPEWRERITSLVDSTAAATILNIKQQHNVMRSVTNAMNQNQEGEAIITSGGEYEVAIEVDPDEIAGVRWSWRSKSLHELNFSVTVVREVEDTDVLSALEMQSLTVSSITKRRDQVLHGARSNTVRVRRIDVLPEHLCEGHHMSYEWKSSSTGLILLRWSSPPVSWWKCNAYDTIEYVVEVVSKDATILTTLGKYRAASSAAAAQRSAGANKKPSKTQSDCGVHFQLSSSTFETTEDDAEPKIGEEWLVGLDELVGTGYFDYEY